MTDLSAAASFVSVQAQIAALQAQVEEQKALVSSLLSASASPQALQLAGQVQTDGSSRDCIDFEVIADDDDEDETIANQAASAAMNASASGWDLNSHSSELQHALAKARLRAEGPRQGEAARKQKILDYQIWSSRALCDAGLADGEVVSCCSGQRVVSNTGGDVDHTEFGFMSQPPGWVPGGAPQGEQPGGLVGEDVDPGADGPLGFVEFDKASGCGGGLSALAKDDPAGGPPPQRGEFEQFVAGAGGVVDHTGLVCTSQPPGWVPGGAPPRGAAWRPGRK